MQSCGHTPEWRGQTVERVLSNGKRLYVTAFKAWLVEQARQPGASVSGLAVRHGINTNLLRHWMQLAHWNAADSVVPDQAAPLLLPVTLSPAAAGPELAAPIQPPPSLDDTPIEIAVGDVVVRLRGEVNEARLRTVLQALRSAA